jgi:ribonuclease III
VTTRVEDKEIIEQVGDEGFALPLSKLERRIHMRFRDRAQLRAALTHPSFWGTYVLAVETRLEHTYERLEFLGDSVISLTICTHLFRRFPDYDQGRLSKLKGYLVSRDVLLEAARKLGLGEFIRVGKGVDDTAGREHRTFLVDCFEALVAAIYLEKGYRIANRFVLRWIKPEIDEAAVAGRLRDYKTELQELVQKRFRELPRYRLSGQKGPEHQKIFCVKVVISGREYGFGEGTSKKEAENAAARTALESLEAGR